MTKKIVFHLLVTVGVFLISPQLEGQINLSKIKSKSKTFKTSKNKNEKNEVSEEADDSGGRIYYVSKKGKNKNDGSKSNPLKNIDKAMKLVTPGDKIYIAQGVYSGTFGAGYLESEIPLILMGSWDENFTKQDIINHPTLFQPDNKSAGKGRKALLRFTKEVDGTIIDNIVWEMGERNLYDPKKGFVEGVEGGLLRLPTEQLTGMNSTVGEPCVSFRSGVQGGDVTIQNCVFVNGANFGLQAAHKSGTFKVLNNVFIANKMAAIEIFGTCAGSKEKETMVSCGDVEIAYNTILFTWSRLKDYMDMGYGVRIMTKLHYNIHHNIIGANIMGGIDNSRFCKDEFIKIDNNIFFGNKGGDLEYFPASNVGLQLYVDEFEDLEFESVSNNRGEAPEMKVNQAYLKGFYGARYTETLDYDPNSASNQWARALGMNQQGKMTSSSSMFMNKYPWKETLLLFGANNEAGAQMPK